MLLQDARQTFSGSVTAGRQRHGVWWLRGMGHLAFAAGADFCFLGAWPLDAPGPPESVKDVLAAGRFFEPVLAPSVGLTVRLAARADPPTIEDCVPTSPAPLDFGLNALVARSYSAYTRKVSVESETASCAGQQHGMSAFPLTVAMADLPSRIRSASKVLGRVRGCTST